MLNTQFIKSITELRLDPSKITKLATQSDNPIYIFNRGKPISVLLDVHLYESMVERLEDALDAVDMKVFEKEKKNKKDWISHNALIDKLIKD